jgi:uncharacterized protein (DUF849 family)
MHPLVIAVAPTGARRGKLDHPALPVTPAEVAADAAACAAAGASVLHLHVRDADGVHTIDAAAYRPALDAVRATAGSELLVQVTTEAVGRFSRHEQMASVRALRPEAVSIAVRELIPDEDAEAEAGDFLAWTASERIGVQFIAYARDDAARLRELVQRGVVPSGSSRQPHAPHALFVLGRYSDGQRAEPRELPPFLAEWPADWPWTVCAFGPLEAQCLGDAIALGGHVRVGFENNLLRADGTPSSGNAEQVAGIRAIAVREGRRVGGLTDARALYCPAAPPAAS